MGLPDVEQGREMHFQGKRCVVWQTRFLRCAEREGWLWVVSRDHSLPPTALWQHLYVLWLKGNERGAMGLATEDERLAQYPGWHYLRGAWRMTEFPHPW